MWIASGLFLLLVCLGLLVLRCFCVLVGASGLLGALCLPGVLCSVALFVFVYCFVAGLFRGVVDGCLL